MQSDTKTLADISKQLEQLTEILTTTKPKLGFGPAPKTTQYIYCNRKHGGLWYTLDSQKQPTNLEHPALTGYLRKLDFKEALRRDAKCHKLHCTIEAEHILYILESAHDSNFSKGLLSAIATLTPEALQQPLTIVPQPSAENAEVLFCRVYRNNSLIFAPYDQQTNWKAVSKTALNIVRLANPQSEAPTASQQTNSAP